jgi:hypothetical protein
MPPKKICPHCQAEYYPKRDVVAKFPVVVRWRYPLQCANCGAQLNRDAPDRVIDVYQVKLGVGE